MAVSCKTGSLSQHFTEAFSPRGYFRIPGAVEQPGDSWCTPCAPQALGELLVPHPSCIRVNLQLHSSEDSQDFICGLTLSLLFTTAGGKGLPFSLFLSCFLCSCHQRRCSGIFLGVQGCHVALRLCWPSALLGKLSDL